MTALAENVKTIHAVIENIILVAIDDETVSSRSYYFLTHFSIVSFIVNIKHQTNLLAFRERVIITDFVLTKVVFHLEVQEHHHGIVIAGKQQVVVNSMVFLIKNQNIIST